MNIWDWLAQTATVLPQLQMQQVFHTASWLAVLSWLSVKFIPLYDKQWRWLVSSLFGFLVLLCWSTPLSSLGLAFQSPSLMSLCLCVAAAWEDLRGPSRRLFYSTLSVQASGWMWLLPITVGWMLLMDTFGFLPWDIYSIGFEPALVWLVWVLMGLWMASAYLLTLAEWHRKVATCVLVATSLFVYTHAPSGNAWDAWLDPGLWLFAHIRWLQSVWFQRTRINHS